MKEILENSLFFGAAISIGTYILGTWIKKKCNFFLFNPLLLSITMTIAVLLVTGIDYAHYNEGAKYLGYLLTPATVTLAIPLYEQVSILKKNLTAILIGIASGVITSLITIFAMSLLFRLSHTEYVTLLPKSITTAIGIGLSEELGGYVAITVAAIIGRIAFFAESTQSFPNKFFPPLMIYFIFHLNHLYYKNIHKNKKLSLN